MLASLDHPPITGAGLVYEPKYDGVRALAIVEPGPKASASASLYSRNGLDKSAQFPEVTAALEAIGRKAKRPLIIDGEVLAIDEAGHPLGFQHIQGRIHLRADADIARAGKAQPAVFIAFDLLRDGDEDLRGLPFAARRLKLQKALGAAARRAGVVRLSDIAIDDVVVSTCAR